MASFIPDVCHSGKRTYLQMSYWSKLSTERLRKAQFPSIKEVAMLATTHKFPKFNLIGVMVCQVKKGLTRPHVDAWKFNFSMDNGWWRWPIKPMVAVTY